MIVRCACDNGYHVNVYEGDIELGVEDIQKGALEIPYAAHNLTPYLTESGKKKVKEVHPHFPFDSHYEYVYIVTERELEFEKQRKIEHDLVIEANRKAHLEGKLAIGDLYTYYTMPITKELLLSKGWHIEKNDMLEKLSDEDKKELEEEGIRYIFENYTFVATNKNATEYKGYWFLTMRYDLSNTVGRDWSCHIDNNCRESVACVDIGNIKQFNKLMDLMDIEYRL